MVGRWVSGLVIIIFIVSFFVGLIAGYSFDRLVIVFDLDSSVRMYIDGASEYDVGVGPTVVIKFVDYDNNLSFSILLNSYVIEVLENLVKPPKLREVHPGSILMKHVIKLDRGDLEVLRAYGYVTVSPLPNIPGPEDLLGLSRTLLPGNCRPDMLQAVEEGKIYKAIDNSILEAMDRPPEWFAAKYPGPNTNMAWRKLVDNLYAATYLLEKDAYSSLNTAIRDLSHLLLNNNASKAQIVTSVPLRSILGEWENSLTGREEWKVYAPSNKTINIMSIRIISDENQEDDKKITFYTHIFYTLIPNTLAPAGTLVYGSYFAALTTVNTKIAKIDSNIIATGPNRNETAITIGIDRIYMGADYLFVWWKYLGTLHCTGPRGEPASYYVIRPIPIIIPLYIITFNLSNINFTSSIEYHGHAPTETVLLENLTVPTNVSMGETLLNLSITGQEPSRYEATYDIPIPLTIITELYNNSTDTIRNLSLSLATIGLDTSRNLLTGHMLYIMIKVSILNPPNNTSTLEVFAEYTKAREILVGENIRETGTPTSIIIVIENE